ncbi:hypothetical protein Pta02_29350 [Planobispora takensis]|uniref:Uncharacterized protein n=1 Tax=Planobispora takensis TaxID=1367882 RepID=A0A8J3SXE6_9ACTN|nr:hypothetical protein Pta02_29350 [Planobispora takensis]
MIVQGITACFPDAARPGAGAGMAERPFLTADCDSGHIRVRSSSAAADSGHSGGAAARFALRKPKIRHPGADHQAVSSGGRARVTFGNRTVYLKILHLRKTNEGP